MYVVYIAGPFRAPTSWGIEQNIRKAETLALEVWRHGFAAVCPHCNTRFFQGELPDNIWLQGDIAILERCDAVLFDADGLSEGVMGELDAAEKKGIPAFTDLDALIKWFDEE